jgi:hypothetical protein
MDLFHMPQYLHGGGAGIEVLGSVELNEFHETFTNLLFNLSH